MRNTIAWVVAAVAAVTMITGGVVYASSDPATTRVAAGQTDLRSYFVPAESLPTAGDMIELTLREAAATGFADPPAAVRYSPVNCVNYLGIAVPDMAELDGRIRVTHLRWDPTSWGPPAQHESFYMDMVVDVPQGLDIDRVREAALACSTGRVDVASRVTGQLRYQEIPAAPTAADESLGLQIDVAFPATNREDAALLARYGWGNGSGLAIRTSKQTQIATVAKETGVTLLYVLSSDSAVGRDAIKRMVNAAKAGRRA